MKCILTILVLAVSTAPASAKLEITNIVATQGPLGPERKTTEVYPLDEVFFRYQVTGVKVDAEGKADVETIMRLVNPNGRMVLEEKPVVERQLSLGGNTYTAGARLTVPPAEKAPPGEYTLTVQVRDKLGMETASFERKFTIKATTFQIIVPRFFHDADSKIPAPAGGLVGQTLHFKLRAIGFDKSKKKVQMALTVHVIGEDGKEVVEKPRVIRAEQNNPEEAAKSTQVNFSGLLHLNRAGNFTLRLTVQDVIGDKSTSWETPLKVSAP
jgi:hypothetical protein